MSGLNFKNFKERSRLSFRGQGIFIIINKVPWDPDDIFCGQKHTIVPRCKEFIIKSNVSMSFLTHQGDNVVYTNALISKDPMAYRVP